MFELIFSWQTLYWLLVILYFPACIGLIIIVLLQKGKNMGFAGAFGVNPGGDTVLGPRASRSLPVRMTYIMATTYIVLCLLFALIEGRRQQGVAPEKVDPEIAALQQQQSDELKALGATEAVGEGEEAVPGDMQPAPTETQTTPVDNAAPTAPASDAPAVDEAAAAEPAAATGDGSDTAASGDVKAEVETMPKETDTP